MAKSLSTTYLRLQAERCQRLSRMCMDLGTARDLRLLAEEYLAEAALMEKSERHQDRSDDIKSAPRDGAVRQDNTMTHQDGPSAHMQQQSQQRNGPKGS